MEGGIEVIMEGGTERGMEGRIKIGMERGGWMALTLETQHCLPMNKKLSIVKSV